MNKESLAIYWVDFKDKAKHIDVRVSLNAKNKDEANVMAKRYVSHNLKHHKTQCVR